MVQSGHFARRGGAWASTWSGCSAHIRLWPRLPHGCHQLLSILPVSGASTVRQLSICASLGPASAGCTSDPGSTGLGVHLDQGSHPPCVATVPWGGGGGLSVQTPAGRQVRPGWASSTKPTRGPHTSLTWMKRKANAGTMRCNRSVLTHVMVGHKLWMTSLAQNKGAHATLPSAPLPIPPPGTPSRRMCVGFSCSPSSGGGANSARISHDPERGSGISQRLTRAEMEIRECQKTPQQGGGGGGLWGGLPPGDPEFL